MNIIIKLSPTWGTWQILQNSGAWKIQLTISINFIFSEDVEEERVMHLRTNNIEFTSYNDANEVFDELFELLRSRYQRNLKTSIRESNFIFWFSSNDVLQMS